MSDYQHTINEEIVISGVGAHSGQISTIKLLPASEDHGIIFKRVDLHGNNLIPAYFENVVNTTLCTVLGNGHGASVATVEHLMSALWGCGIDNALIEVDGNEIPIMDGSSFEFNNRISEVGIKAQHSPRKVLKIMQHVELMIGDKKIEILPDDTFGINFTIDFANQVIGEQTFTFREQGSSFQDDISKARTFGFISELEDLQKRGLGKGVNLSNVIGVADNHVMNEEGLHYRDEFVRHKILDCIGDLYLAGARIKGYIKAFKGGHALNNMLLRELFSRQDAYVLV